MISTDQWITLVGALLLAVPAFILLLRIRPQNIASNSSALKNLQDTVDGMSERLKKQEEEIRRLRELRGDLHYEISVRFRHTAEGELIVDQAVVRKLMEALVEAVA